uniref:B box-type domain-containing protein n=1 Tax=Magallana gigas TaxID=29159 RepID=A0A8W8IGK9_MAGGI
MICDDCDEFICSQCAKTDHKDHDWKTISAAGSQKRRNLNKTLTKLKEEDVKELDKEIEKVLVKFLEEKHSTMSDYSLIDNLKDLENLKSKKERDVEKEDFSVRYRRGDISEELLESMMGQTLNLYDINVSERDSFEYGCKNIFALEAINTRDVYVTDYRNKSIVRLSPTDSVLRLPPSTSPFRRWFMSHPASRQSPSDSVSTVFSTAPLIPVGICQSTERGLLVTLKDTKSKKYQPDSSSRRLVRHVILTGDVICEYEYKEDGQTRLFTIPYRVTQNSNTDICVVNRTGISDGELVIISSSGSLKSVYQGKHQGLQFNPSKVVCDFQCNIIVSDNLNSQVHLLNPNGEFLKYLLTENEAIRPSSMSLYKSTLWVGNTHGLVKVFQYYNNT